MSHVRLISLWAGHVPLLVALTFVRLAVSATWIAQALASAGIFAALVGSSRLVPGDLTTAIVILVAALLVRPALVLLGHALAHRAMSSVKRGLRVRALRAIVLTSAVDPRGRSGRDHALVTDGIENLDSYLSGYIPQVIVTIVTVAAVGTAMIVWNPIAGVVAVLCALSVPAIPRLWDRALAGRGGEQWDAYQDLHAEFVDSMNGMTTLVAYGSEQRRERQLADASALLLRRTISQLRLSLVDSGLAALVLVGAPAAVLAVLTVQDADARPVAVFALVLLSVELVRPLRDLAALWHAGYVGTFSGTALLALLAGRCTDSDESAQAVRDVRTLEMRAVLVRHAGEEEPALVAPEVTFTSGLTAVVGPSGAGKSTLGATVVGLMAPDSGKVLINGATASPAALLSTVSLVPQDPALFGGTVAEEIARGREGSSAKEIARAAAVAGIGIDDASLDLSTSVGEGGSQLSGGQRQRVAIARALVQRRGVLILDEATSALDPASESALFLRLRADRERILVAITHRAAVSALADRVVEIVDGRVVSRPIGVGA